MTETCLLAKRILSGNHTCIIVQNVATWMTGLNDQALFTV